MMSDRDKRSVSWGIGTAGLAGILTAISLPELDCSSGANPAAPLTCTEQPNYKAGAIVGGLAGLLAILATRR